VRISQAQGIVQPVTVHRMAAVLAALRVIASLLARIGWSSSGCRTWVKGLRDGRPDGAAVAQ
jgi:hypothetical protein